LALTAGGRIMAASSTVSARTVDRIETPNFESSRSAVHWSAIIGGAVVSIGVTLILLALGAGIGLSSTSPWGNSGASAAALGVGAGVWIIVVQWISSAFGGYFSGRLRTKWANMHSDEVLFRDTAHGFLAWGLATLVGLMFLSSIIGGGVGAVTSVASSAAQGAAQGAAQQGVASNADPMGYLTDAILTRDAWMHRVDLTRATGHPLELTADHDGARVAPSLTRKQEKGFLALHIYLRFLDPGAESRAGVDRLVVRRIFEDLRQNLPDLSEDVFLEAQLQVLEGLLSQGVPNFLESDMFKEFVLKIRHSSKIFRPDLRKVIRRASTSSESNAEISDSSEDSPALSQCSSFSPRSSLSSMRSELAKYRKRTASDPDLQSKKGGQRNSLKSNSV